VTVSSFGSKNVTTSRVHGHAAHLVEEVHPKGLVEITLAGMAAKAVASAIGVARVRTALFTMLFWTKSAMLMLLPLIGGLGAGREEGEI